MNFCKKLFYTILIILCIILLVSLVLIYNFFFPTNIKCLSQPAKFYTHIIVGAGTTGCVLAARLSENANNKVLLIEAGHEFNAFSTIPLLNTFLQKSKADWAYETESQKLSSKGYKNAKQFWPRGKGLGGSGQINFMIHGFLDLNDLILWEHMGAHNFTNIVHYYNNNIIDSDLRCSYFDYIFSKTDYKKENYNKYVQKHISELSESFRKAIKIINTTNFEFKGGLGTIYKGQRWSSFRSHLLPASLRRNLHILCDTEVTKILFSKKRAIGIHAVGDGRTHTIYTKTEVILSTGTINTPKLLLLSGIGNTTDLNLLKIPTVSDLPGVGLNLHDHLNFPLYISLQKPVSLTTRKILNIVEIWKYLKYREGVYAESPIVATAYMPQEVNIILFGMGTTEKAIFLNISNLKEQTFDAMFPLHKNMNQEGFVFLISCAQVKSRGFIKLKDNNPQSKPIIDPKYLSNNYDLKCIKRGIKLAEKIIKTKLFKKLSAHIHWPDLKECNLKKLHNEEYLECLIKHISMTGYHPGGTCSIGKKDDIYSVVDEKFRIKSLQNIRIIDASVFPTPVSTFPNSFLIAMAEYAVQFLM